MPYVTQAPDDDLDWSFDYDDFLSEGGSPQDTISTSTWSISPDALGSPVTDNLYNDSVSGTKTTVQVANLNAGSIYTVTNIITTSMGRQKSRAFSIRCEQK